MKTRAGGSELRSENTVAIVSKTKGLMKTRASAPRARHGPEFKGVVKKITGKLTNRPDLVSAGRAEMTGGKFQAGVKHGSPAKRKPRLKNPDPHRRG